MENTLRFYVRFLDKNDESMPKFDLKNSLVVPEMNDRIKFEEGEEYTVTNRKFDLSSIEKHGYCVVHIYMDCEVDEGKFMHLLKDQ